MFLNACQNTNKRFILVTLISGTYRREEEQIIKLKKQKRHKYGAKDDIEDAQKTSNNLTVSYANPRPRGELPFLLICPE